jgi:hypothetical protein
MNKRWQDVIRRRKRNFRQLLLHFQLFSAEIRFILTILLTYSEVGIFNLLTRKEYYLEVSIAEWNFI